MTTHGRMLVRQSGSPEEQIHLYTWHDGHLKEAFKLLLDLPKTLFEFSKDSYFAFMLQDKHVHGPWFYNVIMNGYITNKEGDLKDLYNSWNSILFLELYATSVSNWISFIHFNRW